MTVLIFIVLAVGASWYIAVLDSERKTISKNMSTWEKSEAFPKELQGGTIFLNEKKLYCNKPVPLYGRCDQVFQTKRKLLVPVDTKTRNAVVIYESDQIQLSAYAAMLRERYRDYKVANYGFVRVCRIDEENSTEHIFYLKVNLLTDSQLTKLYKEHQKIASGKKNATCSCGGLFH